MTNNKTAFARLERVLSPEYILKKNPGMQRLAKELKLAISRAGLAGANSMRETILDSPTGNDWKGPVLDDGDPPWSHGRQNIWRANNRPPINGKGGSVNNLIGSRLETGNMYNSVSYKRGKIVAGPDKRFKQDIVGGFGWPADQSGNIKDAPSSPMSRSRDSDTTNWRQDPRYFAMQEYGFGKTPGMNSQERASQAARNVLEAEINKLKRKK
jgi:hypothetical protein